MDSPTVLLLGGTGRTGGRVLTQLLDRRVAVRAVVRSAARLPDGVAADPRLTVVEAEVLALSREELRRLLDECDTVISCLGHTLSFAGIFGRPFDLVTRMVARLAAVARTTERRAPLRLILMSTVAAHAPGTVEPARGAAQRLVLLALRLLLPPARDNQRAVTYLASEIGVNDPHLEWVAVRPDTLTPGDITSYRLHDELVSSIFRPGATNMANVAHFMCELACAEGTWRRWAGRLPVIVNAAGPR